MTLSTHKEDFSWGWFTLQRFRPLSSWKEAWWNMGRHGTGEEVESSTSG